MKVFLLAPPISSQRVSLFPRHPPVIVATLAASLRASGADVSALDAFLESLSADETAQRIVDNEPDVLVILPNDVARETPAEVTAEVTRLVRGLAGSIIMVAAGVGNADWMKDLLTAAPSLDGALVGDPEEAVPAVVAALERGEDWRSHSSALSRGDGAGEAEPAAVRELDSLPIPAWDLLPLDQYTVLPHRREGGVEYPLLASRGCFWNGGEFCQDLACVKSPLYRVRSPESVVAEMADASRRWGSSHFLFHDAVFPTRVPWLEQFLAHRKAAGLEDTTWFCMARADHVTREGLQLMKEAGCANVCYGLETGNEELLSRMNKGHDLATSRRAVEWTAAAGINVSATFIFGFPGETIHMAAQTIALATSLPIDFAQFLLTKWHQVPRSYLAEGTLSEAWELTQYDYRGMVFVPTAYGSLDRLKMVRSLAYARFYMRPKFVLRTLARIRSWSDVRRYVKGGTTLVSAMLNR